jgi:hypothetical protein
MADDLAKRVTALFGDYISADDIVEAYSIDHTENGERFISRPTLALGPDDSLDIRGKFSKVDDGEAVVGSFMRRLLRKNGLLRVYHMSIEIEVAHRFKHIATAHYRKALQFYVRAGIINVFMEADRDGPSIWPRFGFELVEGRHQERLRAIVKAKLAGFDVSPAQRIDVDDLVPIAPLLLEIQVEVPGDDGKTSTLELGQLAMRKLYLEEGEPLRMTWWLDQSWAAAYLEDLGVRPSQGKAPPAVDAHDRLLQERDQQDDRD